MTPRHLEVAGAALLSLGPTLVWLHYLRRLEATRPEPLARLLLVFAAGALSTQAVVLFHDQAVRFFPTAAGPGPTPLSSLVFFVLWVGLVEETAKLLAVRLTVYRGIREPSQGLVAAGVAALGFATAENAVYILRFGDPAILLQRWILSTFGHVLMAMFWGYALGITRSGPAEARRPALVLRGLALSALTHGLYDWLLLQGQLVLAVALLLATWKLFMVRSRQAAALSPLRVTVLRAVRECPGCRSLVRRDACCCTHCGARMPVAAPESCPRCLSGVGTGDACPGCGARLVPG